MKLYITKSFILGAVIVIGLCTAGFMLFYSTLPGGPPPEFKQKVALAKSESDRMHFGSLIKEEPMRLSSPIHKREGRVCYVESYCLDGYIKYFGLSEFTDASIEGFNDEMKSLGWTLTESPEDYTAQKDIILKRYDRGSGFTYTNPSGLKTDTIFARKKSNWKNCASYSVCELSKEKSAEQYEAIVAVKVYYETQFQ